MPAPARLAALLALALCGHLLYSSYGLNPSDEGFVLAQARRLLDGQVPHRDFISIRPVFSAVLHMPEVAAGGGSLVMLSRFLVWLQVVVTAYLNIKTLARLMVAPLPERACLLLTALSVALGLHTFPLLAWHTLDGLFLMALGGALLGRAGDGPRIAGCLALGAAALCKQNFAAALPLAALVFRLRPRELAALALPVLIYPVIISALGGAADLRLQLTSQVSLFDNGFRRYLRPDVLLIAPAIGAAVAFMARSSALLAALPVLIAMVYVAVTFGLPLVELVVPFQVFGLALGIGLVRPSRAALWALGTAWVSGVSVGYATPALAVGLLLSYALLAVMPRTAPFRILICATALVVLARFHRARTEHVYHDRPAAELVHAVGDLWPGGRGVLTGARTHAALRELQALIERRPGRPFAILPDYPGYWAGAPLKNPLSIDWANETEAPRPELVARLDADLARLHAAGGFVVVQRFGAHTYDAADSTSVPLERYTIPGRVAEQRAYFAVFE